MKQLQPLVAGVLLFVVTAESSLLALSSKGAAYFGGTSALFAGSKDPIEGRLDTANEGSLIFTADNKPHMGKTWRFRTTE